jgi:predicted deacylase
MRAILSGRIIAILVIIIVVLSGLLFFGKFKGGEAPTIEPSTLVGEPVVEVIGKSVLGRDITAYTYGKGTGPQIVFVGGIHGGYEWNSVLLAYEMMDYLDANPTVIPADISVTIIPSANPDGLFDVIGKEGRFVLADAPSAVSASGVGRFNSNEVDLNRNFDCKWKSESSWRGKTVSAGTEAFSEPEAKAIRDFVFKHSPDSFVFWHSQANSVYASECEDGILPETRAIMNAYSRAAGYTAVDTFDAYEVTGDAEGWLASIGIPAITVELKTHETIEWEKNLAGVKALLQYYDEK